jgi:hypothetical protein
MRGVGWNVHRGDSGGGAGSTCYLLVVNWKISRKFRVAERGTAGLRQDADLVGWAADKLRFVADAQQAAVLTSRSKRSLLACSRQWGKSTVAAIKALHRAYMEPGSLVLVASPSERQSGEFLRKVEEFAVRLGIRPRGDGDNELSLQLPNESRIVGLPAMEATVRGFSAVSLLIIDEAARVPDAMYKALKPVLALKDGDLWLISTPYGKRGFFYEKWAHGGDRWERMAVPATECSRISKNYLEEERSELGPVWFRQEYMCEFVENGAGVFDRDIVEGAITEELAILF